MYRYLLRYFRWRANNAAGRFLLSRTMKLNSSVIARRQIYSLMFIDQIILYLCLINEHLLSENCIHMYTRFSISSTIFSQFLFHRSS